MEALSVDKFTAIKISDTEVVKRVLKGEKELFEILIRRNNQTLYRVIRSYLNSEDDIKDIMQDSYIKAYQKLEQFNEMAAFSTWLIRIGINEALQFLRKSKRVSNNFGKKETIDAVFQLPDTNQMNPEKQLIKIETRALVERAIDLLSEKYRAVFVLHEVEGMTNPEIAACLDLSDANVKVRLHRAKKYLKEELYKLSSDATVFEFGNHKCDAVVLNVMGRI